jgi:HlyD family secretion protein
MPRTGAHKAADSDAAGSPRVWVLKEGRAVAVTVKTGISDGRMTEVSGDELREGMAVITDQRSDGAAP